MVPHTPGEGKIMQSNRSDTFYDNSTNKSYTVERLPENYLGIWLHRVQKIAMLLEWAIKTSRSFH